jgi:hypothetical protein
MEHFFRRLAATLVVPLAAVAALAACPASAHAADAWDAPAFTTPAPRLLEAARSVQRARAVDVVVLLDERIFEIDEQHRLTRTTRLVYRIDSPAGVERWAASSAHWQPWHQARPEIRARVITNDGREHALDQKLLTVSATQRDRAAQIYVDDSILEGPLPAIEVGAVVEEVIVVRDEKPFFAAGAAYRELIGRPVPVMKTRIVIDAPESLAVKRITQLLPNASALETRAAGRVRWTLEQGALDEMRTMQTNLPGDTPAWPSVEFSTGTSWETVAAQYRAMTEPRIRNDDARPLVAGLELPRAPASPRNANLGGSSRPGAAMGANLKRALDDDPRRDFIAQVVGRLHREVRYTGVEFGAARLVPEFPAETLRRKFGDCKDKSTLLVAALRSAGIEAHLALLSAGDDQDIAPELPGLGMFDHAIVYVPGGDAAEDLWIDATAEYARVGFLPAPDSNRLALVIRAGEKALVRTPAMRSMDNRQVETREFVLSEFGPSRVTETTETHGSVEHEYRGWYAGPETKERLDQLKTYARDAYRARELLAYRHTASTDFSEAYAMTLEMNDAPIGFTDLETAAVGINVANITSRLPDYFDERLAEDAAPDHRTSDVVFEPFVTEWRYRIVPPPGFKSRALPAGSVVAIGPARLKSEFDVTADGVVHANWRFDTMKGRYTPAETDALIASLRELAGAETLLLGFDQVGVALRAEGDFKGALRANDELTAQHPRKAVHRLRSASALLDAGLGARAQREALAATKLEPKNALAWKTYGWTLQHDAVGRRFGEGFDRAGAIAAYRKAGLLEPTNTDIQADLAVLLEHDAAGVRYGAGSNLADAISLYQARRKLLAADEAKRDEYANNLHYALLYARRFRELRDILRAQPPGAAQRALLLTAVAAEDGGRRAVEFARELASSEADRRSAMASAGNILTRLREYAAAADLIEAGARGQTTTAATTQRITILRKSTRVNSTTLAATDPRGVVLRAVAGDEASRRALMSPRAATVRDAGTAVGHARRDLMLALAKQEVPEEVGVDLLLGNVRVNVEGDDASGYRVQLRAAGETGNFYVVKEGGAYKLLTVAPMVGPLATLALERVDAGDFAGARRWLDWARLELRAGNSEDPLDGSAFARAWTVGAASLDGGGDLAAARTAAALLLADCAQAAQALPLLLAAKPAGAADRLSVDLALAKVHLELADWRALQAVATRLVAAVPGSALAFRYQQWAGIQLKEWDAVEAASRERLARLPDDSIAREMLVHRAEARGEFAQIATIMQPLIASGRASAAEYNQFAWTSLLSHPVGDDAVEAARLAYDETQGRSFAIAHTLACVYAASGKPREARDLLLKGMEQVGVKEPDDATWYGFGLVAEAYGDAESARGYYALVKKPHKMAAQASSVYALSQARLGALRKQEGVPGRDSRE